MDPGGPITISAVKDQANLDQFARRLEGKIGLGNRGFSAASTPHVSTLDRLRYLGWRIVFGGNVYNKSEFAGAFGDLGVFIAFVVAYITINRMDPLGILLAFGIFEIWCGLVYKTPVPVQPMKAIGGAAIAMVNMGIGFVAGVALYSVLAHWGTHLARLDGVQVRPPGTCEGPHSTLWTVARMAIGKITFTIRRTKAGDGAALASLFSQAEALYERVPIKNHGRIANSRFSMVAHQTDDIIGGLISLWPTAPYSWLDGLAVARARLIHPVVGSLLSEFTKAMRWGGGKQVLLSATEAEHSHPPVLRAILEFGFRPLGVDKRVYAFDLTSDGS